MAYTIQEPLVGITPIANNDAGVQINGAGAFLPPSAVMKPGMIIKASDPIYGEGEFIYLQGVASTVVGSVVTWSGVNGTTAQTFQTALAAATANQGAPVAVSMSANLANSWGWYQITGNAVAATNGTLAAGPGKVYLAGAGQVTSTAAPGAEVVNCVNVSATGTPAAGQAIINVNRSFAQGAIT